MNVYLRMYKNLKFRNFQIDRMLSDFANSMPEMTFTG